MAGRCRVLGFVLCIAACAGEPGGEAPAAGRLTLEVVPAAGLPGATIPVRAAYCLRDSTVTITGSTNAWSAAVALRTSWPAASPGTWVASGRLAGLDSAAFAARPLRDSVSSALVATGGVVRVDASNPLAGSFAVEAVRDSGSYRVSGRFTDVPVTERCP